jgi:predicted flap endonuclease-1-like 5' DNA nuclease
MPWVLWDIVVPLLITFLVGLATGWLLWRWRRQQQPLVQPQVVAQTEQVPLEGAATVLIEERDAALQRAEAAELQLAQMTDSVAQSEDAVGEIVDIDDLLDAPAEEATAETAVVAIDNETDDELAETRQALKKEQAAKAELEQAFMDLNNRYKNLNHQMEEVMDDNNASQVRDAAGLQSRYDSSQQQLTEQKQSFEQELDQHKAQNEDLSQRLTESEEELQRLKQEKADIEKSLLAATTQALQSPGATQSGTVHHISSYSPARRSAASAGDPVGAGTNDVRGTPASVSSPQASLSPALNHATDSDADAAVASAPVASSQEETQEVSQHDESESAIDADAANEAAQPVSQVEHTQVEHTQVEQAPAEQVNTPVSAKPRAKKATANGYTPTGWSVPEITPKKSERDDLQEIKGVGPVLEKLLHKTGVYYFRQVALLDKKGVQELDDQLPQFSGRIQRDKWVQQAKTLHRTKYGSAAKP